MRVFALLQHGKAYLDYLMSAGADADVAVDLERAAVLLGSGGTYQVAMVDAFLNGQCGVAVAEQIGSKQPWCRVFVVAQWLTSPLLQRVQRIPNATVISRSLSQVDFMCSVVGGAKCTAASLHWLVREISRETKLSRQQERLLWLNLWGYSDQQIAKALGIQLHTVQDYQLALRRKTGVRSKAGYLRLVLEYLGAPAPLELDAVAGRGA